MKLEYLKYLQKELDKCESNLDGFEFLANEAFRNYLLIMEMLRTLREEYDIEFSDLIVDEDIEEISECEIKFCNGPCCCEDDDFDEDETDNDDVNDDDEDSDDKTYTKKEIVDMLNTLLN